MLIRSYTIDVLWGNLSISAIFTFAQYVHLMYILVYR